MDISFIEIFFIGVIAFLVLGPEELIKKSQALGAFWAKTKTQLNNYKILVQEEINQKKNELKLPEIQEELQSLKEDLNKE